VLLGTFISVLSLYRATAPVHHAAALASAPAIGMQFAQDIDWISDHIDAIWHKSRGQVMTGEFGQLAPQVERGLALTKKMGLDWRAKQVVSAADEF
jgi:hypothetical protein